MYAVDHVLPLPASSETLLDRPLLYTADLRELRADDTHLSETVD